MHFQHTLAHHRVRIGPVYRPDTDGAAAARTRERVVQRDAERASALIPTTAVLRGAPALRAARPGDSVYAGPGQPRSLRGGECARREGYFTRRTRRRPLVTIAARRRMLGEPAVTKSEPLVTSRRRVVTTWGVGRPHPAAAGGRGARSRRRRAKGRQWGSRTYGLVCRSRGT